VAQRYWFDPNVKRIGTKAFAIVVGTKQPLSKTQKRRVSEGVVNLVDELLDQGRTLVRLVESDAIYPELELDLGDRLRKKYGLRDVWVVNTKFVRSKHSHKSNFDEDDDVHSYLANWTARMLSTLIRRGDVVGMGSGRALRALADAVSNLSGFHGCQAICSLTGRMKVRSWGPAGQKSTVDADDNARRIHAALPTGSHADLNLLGTDITDDRKAKRDQLKDFQRKTTIAVVGIGALVERHQLRRAVRESQFPRELSKVKAELKALDEFAEDYDEQSTLPDGSGHVYRHVVSDICNHLFLNEQFATETVPPTELQELRSLVESINHTFLNTPPNVLAGICRRGAVVAVAGGRHKAAAIHDVLHHPAVVWVNLSCRI
jgi:DNA-binding transcriptional regulator LsrR (DeoR family)